MFKKFFQRLGGDGSATPPPRPMESSSDDPAAVTDDTFDERVLGCAGLSVVDFWADWCQPCHIMSAHVEHLALEFGAMLTVFTVDVDENPLVTQRFEIMGMPTLIFFRNGEVVHRIMGAGRYDDLQRLTHDLLTSESSPGQSAAE
jgi:thioredoxin 1